MGQNYEKILILTKLYMLKVNKLDKIVSYLHIPKPNRAK